MNLVHGQNSQSNQNEDIFFFEPKGLDLLIKQMGFEDIVQFDEKPRQMIIDIGNEFMNNLLEQSMRVSQKRQQNDDQKNQKPKACNLRCQIFIRLYYIIKVENCLRMPQQNFSLEKDS